MKERMLFAGMTSSSLVAMLVSPAFTPAIALSLFVMLSCGIAAVYGYLKTSVLNIAISSLTIALGPLDIGHFHNLLTVLMFGIPFLVGYGGLYWGVSKVQSNAM